MCYVDMKNDMVIISIKLKNVTRGLIRHFLKENKQKNGNISNAPKYSAIEEGTASLFPKAFLCRP